MAPPKRPWFRFYTEAIWDRKLRRLTPAHRWLWVAVLATARQSPRPGVLLLSDDHPASVGDLADAAALSRPTVKSGMAALEQLGLVRRTPDAWDVVKWNERQFESDTTGAGRVMKHRCNADVTHQSTETETDNCLPDSPPAKARRKPLRPIPIPFELDDKHYAWAKARHPTVDVPRETERFVNYWRGKDGRFADWHMAWRNWIGKAGEGVPSRRFS